MKISKCALLFACLAAFSLARPARCAEVRGWEGTIDLPTYALGQEDPNPAFSLIDRHQIYPYTMLDDLTDRRELKTYRALFLENDYLKATILPEVGGRLYSLYDKVSKREVFYRNHVVKYGLVALRGAWISGGIEFNFPNGHTVATVSPVASRLVTNPDGSATAIVGGMDWVTEMHWEVALTLRPRQARLEQHVTLFNSTPLENLYWYWANAAVPATSDMQFIYPMREANPHSREEIWSYPLWQGVDYSWYKNIRQPTSLFGREVHRNFFGAYYHDSDYGVVHVADFREVPGKKIWSWGVAGDGLIWTDLLTDQDGAYNEIQSGRYETQLNQEFLPPHCAESWTEYWYPVRGLDGGFVEATNDLALNVRFLSAAGTEPSRFELAINPTVDFHGAKMRAKLGDKLLREFGPLSFEPMTTAKFIVPVENLDSAKKSLSVEIDGADSQSLLRWSAADPVDGNKDFVPAAGKHQPEIKPINRMTAEELYLRGVEQEKNGNAEAAAKTYRQVLQRDPRSVPALLKLAHQDYRAADFPSAERLLAGADIHGAFASDIEFASGMVDRAARHPDAAKTNFSTVVQAPPFEGLTSDQLGEIEIREKKYGEAAQWLKKALENKPEDALTLTDLAVALRLEGKAGEAQKAVDRALESMPLLPFALVEKWQIAAAIADSDLSAAAVARMLKKTLNYDVQNYLQVAAWYRSLGDLAAADAVLERVPKDLPSQTISPMVYYYLASNAQDEADAGRARELLAKASSASTDKVFPQRLADALVLQDALAHNPQDAHAHYFLGTFLFAHNRYDDAAREWLEAKKLGFDDSVLERNLGVYAWRVKKDLSHAAACYEEAIRLSPSQYRLYPDLDEIYAELGDTKKRDQLFAHAPIEVLDRDTVRVRNALRYIQEGDFLNALSLLNVHDYKPWEGGAIVRQMFVLGNIANGKASLAAKNAAEAEKAIRRALEYPKSHGVGKPDKPHDEETWYWLGVALAAEGKASDSQAAWKTAVKQGKRAGGVSGVFAAGALVRLGKKPEGEGLLAAASALANHSDAGAHSLYVAGLAEHLRDHEQEARRDFRRALELDPLLWQARYELDRSTGIARIM